MGKSVLIVETPSCCELCRFIDYEPKCRCRMLSYKNAKIDNRFSKLENCPLRELPEKQWVASTGPVGYSDDWNECLDKITGK